MLACLLLCGCAWMPSELNLSPLYRHRLAEDGTVLEYDVLWPVFHYERTADGGDDFRVRPLWRRVTEPQSPVSGGPAIEYQFLWPLGRTRTEGSESSARLFPLIWYRTRQDDLGLQESDWYFLFPFVWGGSRSDGKENYVGIFPLFGDFPDFLTYCRFTFVLWPLYLRLEKEGRVGTTLLWPFIGWGHDTDGTTWHRFIPLWSFVDGPRHFHRALLWPLISWGIENLDSDDPIRRWLVWPLFGRQWNSEVAAWTLLFPLFQSNRIGDHFRKVDVLWPIFRFEEHADEKHPFRQWWLFPLIARTISEDQWAWNFLWPLIWISEYHDPRAVDTREFVLPFHLHTRVERSDGSVDDWREIWPLAQWSSTSDGQGDRRSWFNILSPWIYRAGNALGLDELWGWAWTLVRGERRSHDDTSFALAANLFTTRTRKDHTQSSVPFLFNYESDARGSTLRLFQFIPIPFGGGTAQEDSPR